MCLNFRMIFAAAAPREKRYRCKGRGEERKGKIAALSSSSVWREVT